VFDLTVQI